MKTFITGVYGSGKTFLAKRIAKEQSVPFINFDEQYDYQNKQDQFNDIMGSVPENFVMDAIPFDVDYSWNKFLEYNKTHDCKIICAYCPNQKIWLDRVIKKQSQYKTNPEEIQQTNTIKNRIIRNLPPKQFIKMVGRMGTRLLKKEKIIPKLDVSTFPEKLTNIHYSKYRRFVINMFPILRDLENVSWFDSVANEYTSYDEAIKRINPELFELEERIFQKEYDTFYGDVELLNLIGYSTSYLTWESIKDITDWKGKTVLDIGCFHGYFSFKIEKEGAKHVIGLERGSEIVKTATLIRDLMKSKCEFRQWTGGDDFPECDTILLLNVLHHFGNIEFQTTALKKIKPGTEVVFEVNDDQIKMIKSLFDIQKTLTSHRHNRIILLSIKK